MPTLASSFAKAAKSAHCFSFTAGGFSGEVKECDEGVLEWVPREKLRQLPMWAGDRIFLDLLDRVAPFFSLKLGYRGEKLTRAVLNGRTIV